MTSYNRRTFLKSASAAGFAGAGGLLPILSSMPAMAQSNGDYKALVFVFLFGGMDNWDTVIPYNNSSRGTYEELRGTLIDEFSAKGSPRRKGELDSQHSLLLRRPNNTPFFPGRHLMLAPEMQGMVNLFNQQKLAIVGNVGPLIAPTTSVNFPTSQPPQLFSHNDQQSTWMSLAVEGAEPGWGANLAEASPNGIAELSTVSTGSNSIFLSGAQSNQYCISLAGDVSVSQAVPAAASRYGLTDALRRNLFEAEYDGSLVNRIDQNFRFNGDARFGRSYKEDYASILERANSIASDINNNRDDANNFSTSSSSSLARQLGRVTEMIAVGKSLGLSRQVFFVRHNGFDTHDNEARDLPGLQQDLSDSIVAFQNAIGQNPILDENEILLATGSDFGRSLTINGDGTDHGWGSHHFVVGGAVNGRQIYGDVPEATLGHAQDAGNGRLIPTTSVEEYAAPIASWFGLDSSSINTIFPRLSNFNNNVGSLIPFI